jgi:hypothetical protein
LAFVVPQNHRRCTAKAKSRQARCRFPRVPGRKVCRYHGGLTPVGPAAPNFKHGRHSKYLPKRLLDDYQAAASDKNILVLREDIALLDVRIGEVLGRLDTGESEERWTKLAPAWADFMMAAQSGDKTAQVRLIDDLDRIIRGGSANAQIWSEVTALVEKRRRLVDSEQKREVAADAMIPVAMVIGYLAAVVLAVKEAARKYAEPEVATLIIQDTSAAYVKMTRGDNKAQSRQVRGDGRPARSTATYADQ